jgi:hypothetical protein
MVHLEIDDLMKFKRFPPYCIESILHSMLQEAVIPLARYVKQHQYKNIICRYHDNPNQGGIYAKTEQNWYIATLRIVNS